MGERAFVEIVELAADRQAMGELGVQVLPVSPAIFVGHDGTPLLQDADSGLPNGSDFRFRIRNNWSALD